MLFGLLAGWTAACGPSGARTIESPNVVTPDAGAGGTAVSSGGASGAPGSAGAGGVVGAGGLGGGTGPSADANDSGGAGPGESPGPDAPVAPPDLGAETAPPPVDTRPVEDTAPVPPPDLAPPGGSDTAPPSTLALGLIGHWSLEEGAGATVSDSIGHNPGTMAGATWVKPGFKDPPSKAALRFDGKSVAYVELGTRNLPDNDKPQSVAFWFRFSAAPSGNDAAVAVSLTNGSSSGARLKLGLRSSSVMASKSNSDILVSDGLPSKDVWHHYVYSYDGKTNHLSIDGAEKKTSTTAPDSAPVTNARIGAIYNDAEKFTGDVDEVRIYNRALSAAEVAALARGEE